MLGTEPDHVYVGPRRLVIAIDDLPERGGGPGQARAGRADRLRRARASRRRPPRGSRAAPASTVEELERRDGHVWAHVRRRVGRRHAARAAAADRARPRVHQVDEVGGRRDAASRGPIRWLVAKVGEDTVEASRRRAHRRRATRSGTAGSIRAPSRSRTRRRTRARCARRASSRTPTSGGRRSSRRSTRSAAGRTRPGSSTRSCTWSSSRTSSKASFDERFLELPERVIVTAMQSHQRYFPLGGRRVAIVANARRPGGRPRRPHARAREPARRRVVHVRARRRRRHRGARASGSARSSSCAAAGTFADKRDRLLELVDALGGGDASREAARLAKADQAAELVREFPELEGYIGGEYARLAGFPEGGHAPRSRSSTSRTRRAGRCRRPSPGRRSLPPTRWTRSRSRSRSASSRAARATRTRCGARRSACAGWRSRASCGSRSRDLVAREPQAPGQAGRGARRRLRPGARSPTSSRSGSRACSTCRSSSCARRAARRDRAGRRRAARDRAGRARPRAARGAPHGVHAGGAHRQGRRGAGRRGVLPGAGRARRRGSARAGRAGARPRVAGREFAGRSRWRRARAAARPLLRRGARHGGGLGGAREPPAAARARCATSCGRSATSRSCRV